MEEDFSSKSVYEQDTTLMRLYKKKYKYVDTKTKMVKEFTVYDILTHLKDGVHYKARIQNSDKDAYSGIVYKLINENKITVKLISSFSRTFRKKTYEWANTIFMKVGNQWAKSDSGWVMPVTNIYRIMKKQNKTGVEIDRAIGNYMRKYFDARENARVIIHANNYAQLSEHEKKFVSLVFLRSGKVRLHKINNYYICVPPNSNLSPLRDVAVKRGVVKKEVGYGVGLSALNIPYKELTLIEIQKVIDRFVFNKYSYTLYSDLDISKKITK